MCVTVAEILKNRCQQYYFRKKNKNFMNVFLWRMRTVRDILLWRFLMWHWNYQSLTILALHSLSCTQLYY